MRKTLKIASLIIAAALLICGIVGITSSAEEPKLAIATSNVAYNDMMHLAFTLTGTEALPDGAEAGIIIWKDAQDEYTVQNASYKTFTEGTDGKNVYYKSYGIAAPEIGREVYVAACYKLDGAITVTEKPFKYSIVDYMVSRLNENITAVQANLYYRVLAYGLASDTVLKDDSYLLFKANGGTVGNTNLSYCLLKNPGSTLTLRAEYTNAEGKYFVKWVDVKGNTVSENRVYSVTPEANGLHEYTAVYGEKSESAYDNAFTFNDFATGEIDVGTPDLTKAPTSNPAGAYSGTNYKQWQTTYDNANIFLSRYLGPTANITGQTDAGKNIYEFVTDENGNYSIGIKDSFHIVEKSATDKALSVHRDFYTSGWNSAFTNNGASSNMSTYAEVDITYDTFNKDNVQHHVSIEVYNGSSKVTYRTNLFDYNGTTESYLYAENTKSGAGSYASRAVKDENGETKFFNHVAGEKFTFGAEFVNRTKIINGLETVASYIDYYINGEYFGSLELSKFGAHSGTLAEGKYYITKLSVTAISSARDDITIDNVCFK